MVASRSIRAITSRHNPLVARFRALTDEPDPSGSRLLLDGLHLVSEARASGIAFEVVAVAGSRLSADTEEGSLGRTLSSAGVDVVEAPDAVFASLSPVNTPSGIVAIAERPTVTTAEICAAADAFVVVAVDVQDPGNVGALVRVAEAVGATGMLVCGISASPFSWKAVRGSMGSVLRLPVAAGVTSAEALECLRRSGVRAVAGVARGGLDPDALDWSGKAAIVLGGEGAGLSQEIVNACDARVSVPMAPEVDSLNVATAGAILVYAARRQRTQSSGRKAQGAKR
jgi:TrmH family RNA methyltransferase